MTSARAVQRTYLVLMLGNTLAASFIWGINTIFLLDAGLSNLEAFAANALFSAGMVLFEVPTGIVADGIGRRASYLLGTVTLTLSTLLYVYLWEVEAAFWAWAIASILLGLGFTFFSGAVEAWLVDALTATGYEGTLEAVFGKGQIVGGIAMLTGSVAGGFLAAHVSLGFPFVVRSVVLAVMFVVAFWLMHDIGFTRPERRDRPLPRSADLDRLDRPRAACPRREVADGAGAVHRRRRHLRLLRAAAVSAGALRRPAGVPDRRHLGRDRGGRADPRRRRGAADPAPVQAPHLGAGDDRARECDHADPDGPDRALLGRDRADRLLGPAVRGHDTDPPDLPERADPVHQRATILSFDSMMTSGGGVWAQPVLGKSADVWGYSTSYVISGGIALLALPFIALSRRENAPADLVASPLAPEVGREVHEERQDDDEPLEP